MLQWTLGYIYLFQLWFSQGICPIVGLLGHMAVSFLVFFFFFLTLFYFTTLHRFCHRFLRNWHTVLHSGCYQFTFPPAYKRFPFPPHSLQHLLLADFLMMTILTGVWRPHCSFDLHFSNNEQCWAFFDVFISHLDVLFEEINVCFGLVPILWLGSLLFWCWTAWTICLFWRLTLCQLLHLQLFSPILKVLFSSCLWFPLLCKIFQV